ncbi:MAG: DUF1634 domain-containing protein [Methanomassiliicoccales archaeon]|nr:MAG: DUF1634 domain-containing protein [Methanomassiliicoccales archaeon]
MTGERINEVLHRVLLFGMILSLTIMVLGLLLHIAYGTGNDEVVPIERLPTELANGTPLAIVQLGILVLISTPLMRVVAAMVVFSYQKDVRFVVLSLIVLSMIVVAMLVKV